MNVGVSIGFQNPPQWRIPWPDLYAETLEFVRQAEIGGLDEVWISEHHFVDDGYCPSPLAAAAAVATTTSRIRVGTKVVLLPFYDPLRLAEDAATVDVISNGRLDLGLAAGYRRAEFEGFRIDPRQRGVRMDEGLNVLQHALTGEPFTHRGRFFEYDGVQVVPPPVQRPLPLWLGGRSAAAMRRAANHGAHLALADFIIDNCEEDYAKYRDALSAAGRDPSDYYVCAVASLFLDDDPERAWTSGGPHLLYQQNQYQQWFREAGDRPTDNFAHADSLTDLRDGTALVGSPEDVAERLRSFHARVPFTHFSFWCLLPGMRLEPALRSLALFVERVLPVLRSLD